MVPNFPKYLVEDLVRQLDRLIDRREGRDDADIDPPLPCKPDVGDQARAEVDQTAIKARHVGVGIEHKTGPRGWQQTMTLWGASWRVFGGDVIAVEMSRFGIRR